jgi:4'-phosphopantetheinyl transferase
VWRTCWRDLLKTEVQACLALLSPDERARLAGYRRPEDRMRFGITRGLLRRISGACLGRDGAALQPVDRAGGKPWWWDAEALRFSVSHSGDWIDLAFAWQIEVGVDVQAMPQRIDMEGIAALAMHPDEEALLRSIADQTERQRLFLSIWAGREACLKATGEGIFADRRTLSVLPVALQPCWQSVAHADGRRIGLHRLDAPAGHGAALAALAEDPARLSVRLHTLPAGSFGG